MTDDLVTWLRQQLDELEESASGADGAYIYFDAIDDEARDFYLERDLPKLVLADVDAKRRIIEEHYPTDPCDAHDANLRSVPCPTLRLLALPYADREGYDESWRP